MYSKIESRFWQDEKIRTLSTEAKLIFLYLLSCPHRNMLGLFYLPIAYVSHDLGMPFETLSKGFQELLDKGLISLDNDNHMVFIRHFLRYNPLENKNQVKGAINKLKELPNTPLLAELYEFVKTELKPQKAHYNLLLAELEKRLGKGLDKGFERVSKGFKKGSETHSKQETETVTETVTETETVTVTEEEIIIAAEEEKSDEKFDKNSKQQQQLQQLYEIFSYNIHPPTPIEIQKLQSWLGDVEIDVIILAIEEAVKVNKRNLKYIEAILKNWKSQGCKTKADVEAYLRDWRDERNKKTVGETPYPYKYFDT